MSIAKENASCGKSIQIGCQGLRMSSHNANPVVEIVDRNKQDIGWRRLARRQIVDTAAEQEQRRDQRSIPIAFLMFSSSPGDSPCQCW